MEKIIYICDDEEGMRRYLSKMLGGWGYKVEPFADPRQLLHQLKQPETICDLLLLDVKMPQMDGIEVLAALHEIRPELQVLMMTGHGTIESAVEAMKSGAYDYLAKPFPQEKLHALLVHALERNDLVEENRSLKRELQRHRGDKMPVFVSVAFRKAHDFALQVAASNANVLVLGESGTGKELIAHTIHNASARAGKRMLTINCAALSDTLLESQLFGHLKGAFTGALQNQKGLFEEADGSTLFMDEIGDISPGLQAKLLRMLQEGEFLPVGATAPRYADVRVIAVTNKDLPAEIAAGRFREDLYYRLNVLSIELPPLRERRDDILPLVEHFLGKVARKLGRTPPRIAPRAIELLQGYHWPGNVRELENVIERAVILSPGGVIEPEVLPLNVSPPPSATSRLCDGSNAVSLREAEIVQIRRSMRQTGGNKTRSAQILGITRKTLDRKIREYDLNLDEDEG